MNRLILIIFAIIIVNVLHVNWKIINPEESLSNKNEKILCLSGDLYGGSFSLNDTQVASIRKQLEDLGYSLVIASDLDTLKPCPWYEENYGVKYDAIPIIPHIRLSDVKHIEEYVAIMILPGRNHSSLIENENVLNLLRAADKQDMVIAAWCRGASVLAAAGIIEDKTVIGHADHKKIFADANANYIDYNIDDQQKFIFSNITPPIADGNIITTVRSRYYRNQMCQLIKNAIDKRKSTRNDHHKIKFSLQPVWEANDEYYPTGIKWIDLDKNGFLDLIVSNGIDYKKQPHTAFYNYNGKLSTDFSWKSTLEMASGNIFSADLDNDNDQDIIISHIGLSNQAFAPGKHVLYYNNKGLANSPDWKSQKANGFTCSGGDFDGDGDMDLVFGQGANALKAEDKKFQPTVIYFNSNGQFDSIPGWQTDSSYLTNDLAAVDIDNDGDLDLCISGRGYGVSVFYSKDWKLETTPSWHTNSIIGARQMDFGDYNDDGFPDLAVAVPGNFKTETGKFVVFKNNNGVLEKEPCWSCDLYDEPSCVIWADFDSDDDLDLAGGGFYSHFGIFENDKGTISNEYSWAYYGKGKKYVGQQIALGDYDEDYIVDTIQSIVSDGIRKLFYLKKNIHEIVFISVNNKVLDYKDYCYDLTEGWLSLKTIPEKDATIKLYYRYSKDLDAAITTFYSIYLLENMH